ncbi:MAG: glutamate 5-kinase [Puniceicoccaceae bacterium 5H]|nr:MAG: glutamate 5-kinase [Puniceicoccaceae bacterium 5H]
MGRLDAATVVVTFLASNARRIVIKIGTNTLTQGGRVVNQDWVERLCCQVAELQKRGLEVILVSSGAIGLGMGRLGLERRPRGLNKLQACAAIGQSILMECWARGFGQYDATCAQVLLTHEDLKHRERHVAVRETLEQLLRYGVVPVINENDTVSTDEIKFGDNDLLSALTASLTNADLLVILTTAPGLLDLKGSGQLVPVVETITPEIEAMAGGSVTQTSVGGMISKIQAAKVATGSGCGVYIGDGTDPVILMHLANGRAVGTFFLPNSLELDARHRWMAFFQRPTGRIVIDPGAVTALREQGVSLLAKGVTSVDGAFLEGEVIDICNPEGVPIARGQSNYAAHELASIVGKRSEVIQPLFPQKQRYEVVHRDHLVLL